MKTEIIEMTPEMAKKYIATNQSNRPVSKSRVADFVKCINDDQFFLTHQGIAISSENILLDGQHRLLAIIKANKAVRVQLTTNADPNMFKYIDTGSKRTNGQMMAVLGIKNYNGISAAITKYHVIRQGYKGTDGMATVIRANEAIMFYEQNKQLIDHFYKFASNCYAKVRLLDKTLSVAVMMYLSIDKKHPLETIQNFFLKLFGIEEAFGDTAVKLLFQVLIKDLSANKKTTSAVKLIYIIKAWNAYISRKDIKRLNYNVNEKEINFI